MSILQASVRDFTCKYGHYVKESASISENQVEAALEVYKHQRGKIKYTIMEYNLIARQFLRDNLPALHAVLHRVKWRINRWRNENRNELS